MPWQDFRTIFAILQLDGCLPDSNGSVHPSLPFRYLCRFQRFSPSVSTAYNDSAHPSLPFRHLCRFQWLNRLPLKPTHDRLKNVVLYSTHHPYIMSCRFSGIFYIQTNKRNLSTLFFDALGTPWELKIKLFFGYWWCTNFSFFGSVHQFTGSIIHRLRSGILVKILVKISSLIYYIASTYIFNCYNWITLRCNVYWSFTLSRNCDC